MKIRGIRKESMRRHVRQVTRRFPDLVESDRFSDCAPTIEEATGTNLDIPTWQRQGEEIRL